MMQASTQRECGATYLRSQPNSQKLRAGSLRYQPDVRIHTAPTV